ncbi:hypothetical protein B0O80DRAFT_436111 [Mortierella sp. GBAus27b]|nr:hypothetical protein B0O80DRAFT_436111 [Mortierella sp. GBAus27b]
MDIIDNGDPQVLLTYPVPSCAIDRDSRIPVQPPFPCSTVTHIRFVERQDQGVPSLKYAETCLTQSLLSP